VVYGSRQPKENGDVQKYARIRRDCCMTREQNTGRRDARRDRTRQRIVEATVEMHETVGTARTTISAIAEKAGVQRLTVYRHFPDERALFRACSGHWNAANPPPDPASWTQISEPEARLGSALAEVYAYHRRTEPMMSNVVRDAQVHPLTREMAEPYFQHWERMRYVLATGWGVGDERLALLLGTLGHALDFQTWSSLVRQQGLSDEQAVGAMVGMVRCLTRG
jgi:AcrR family transcriptional regulator